MLTQAPQVARRAAVARLAPRSVVRANPQKDIKNIQNDAAHKGDEVAHKGSSMISEAKGNLVEQVERTVEPRVDDLRNEQIGPGTSNLADIMMFSGPGPELINGRLAMGGFFFAVIAELTSGKTAFDQFRTAPWAVLGFAALITVASIIPIAKGTKILDSSKEGLYFGKFNFTNELVNGRAAMLGLVIVLVYEAATKVPLFVPQ